MSKKPSGIIGPIGVTVTTSNSLNKIHQKTKWPTDQLGIQDKICDLFLEKWREIGVEIKKESGGTTELDYLLTLPNGEKIWLELMEAVFPYDKKIPYQSGSQTHDPKSYADVVYKKIEEKSKLYGFNHERPIDLLIYITHEQYNPNQAAKLILTKYLQERKHSFRYVFFLVPAASDLILLYDLLNPDRKIEIPSIEELEKQIWISLPAANFKLYNQSGEISS